MNLKDADDKLVIGDFAFLYGFSGIAGKAVNGMVVRISGIAQKDPHGMFYPVNDIIYECIDQYGSVFHVHDYRLGHIDDLDHIAIETYTKNGGDDRPLLIFIQ